MTGTTIHGMTCTIDDYACNKYGIYYQDVRIAYYYLGFLMLDNKFKTMQLLLEDYGFDVLLYNPLNDTTINFFQFVIDCFIHSCNENDYMNPVIFSICQKAKFSFNEKFLNFCKQSSLEQVCLILNKRKLKNVKRKQEKYVLNGLWYEYIY